MHEGLTFPQLLGELVYNASIFTFKWVPATLISLQGTQSIVLDPATPVVPITQPVTVGDATQFMSTFIPPEKYAWLVHWWGIYVAFSIFVSIILLSIIIYGRLVMRRMHHEDHDRIHALQHAHLPHDTTGEHIETTPSKRRWDHVLSLIETGEDQQIRLAILEADIMLGDLLDSLGYKGETLGDKMKVVQRSQFNTIDLAWEAHRLRNVIAHEGSLANIPTRDMESAINNYAAVFREFKIVP